MNGPWKVYFEQKSNDDRKCRIVIEELSKHSTKAVWYFHPNGKQGKGPHFHGLIYDFNRTDETCRNYIKKTLNLDGLKQEFAVSNKLPKKMGGGIMTDLLTLTYITYMSKGQFDPYYYVGYESEYLQLLKLEWKDKEIKGTELIFVEETKKKMITQWDMAQQVLTLTLADNPDISIGDNISVYKIVDHSITVLKENKKLAHKRAVANITQDVMATVNRDEYIKQIMRMI